MDEPDVIFHGGQVITLNSQSTLANAAAVRAGTICEVGSAASLVPMASSRTRVIDLAGRTLLPGFVDAHPHMDREGC